MTIRSTLGRFAIVTTDALQAIVTHPEGTSAVVAVYVALMTHADRDEADAWRCSIKSIADEAGVSERTVRMAKTVLKELGLVETTPNFTPDGDRAWDSYLMHFAPFQAPAESAPPPAEFAPGHADSAAYSSDQEADQEAEKHLAPSDDGAIVEADTDEQDFELFWATYRRIGPKKKAKECWKRARKKASAEEIQHGLEQWMLYWDSPRAASIKWPQGWLNEERWNDEPPWPARPAGQPSPNSPMGILKAIAERDHQ